MTFKIAYPVLLGIYLGAHVLVVLLPARWRNIVAEPLLTWLPVGIIAAVAVLSVLETQWYAVGVPLPARVATVTRVLQIASCR